MKHVDKNNSNFVLLSIACLLLITLTANTKMAIADVVNADSCSESDVKAAIGLANEGDTVQVPAGFCTWSGFAFDKGAHLKGAGSSQTQITVTGTMNIVKNQAYNLELSGFTFSKSGGGNSQKMFVVDGLWNHKPIIIHHNTFTVNNCGMFGYQTNGGLMHHNTFNGNWNDSGIQHYVHNGTQSWSTPDSMGNRDTNGELNLYIEDNIFNGMTNQGTDFGDASRIVFRHNTLTRASFNTHGLATSPLGIRHFEIYNNQFLFPDNTHNQNWMIWLRGGTGVIYNNQLDDIKGQLWGDKSELLLSVRAANVGSSYIGGCPTGYPAPHQVGQNHDGTNQYTDPIRVWNNTGTWTWGIQSWESTCGQDINDYIQEERDIVFASTPKPGYVPYPYPHPLSENTAANQNILDNNSTTNFSLARTEFVEYSVDIPEGANNFEISMAGINDADLYVKRQEIDWPADAGIHDEFEFKAPFSNNSDETVLFGSPAAGIWHILVNGYSASQGSIRITWDEGSNLSKSFSLGSKQILRFNITVPAGAQLLEATISGIAGGDADLYLKNAPILWPDEAGKHDEPRFKAPYTSGSDESIVIKNPSPGIWYILIQAYSAEQGSFSAVVN